MTPLDPPRLPDFRCADEVALPSDEQLSALHDRLVDRFAGATHAGRSRRLLPALIAAALLAGSVSVLAKTILFRPAPSTSITVPAGSEVHLKRKRRFHARVTGPATAEVGPGDEGALALSGGSATVNADEQPVNVAVGEVSAMVSPFAAAEVAVASEGDARITAQGGAVTVRRAGAPAVVLNGGESWRAAPAGASGRASAKDALREVPPRPPSGAPAVREREQVEPPPAVAARVARSVVPAAETAAVGRGPDVMRATPRPAASAILRQALERLRGERDPGGALALLEAHRTELETGALAGEGDLVRLEALLALGHRGEAARLLETMDVAASRRDLHLLRGELRADQGRCAEAVADFQAARRLRSGDEIDERALHGQAACLARLGEPGRAQAALEQYLARYPAGSFAAEARRALQN